MSEQELYTALQQAQNELRILQARLDRMEGQSFGRHEPHTALLSDSFLKRAFAVFGHYFVASLIIVVPIYAIIFIVVMLAALAG